MRKTIDEIRESILISIIISAIAIFGMISTAYFVSKDKNKVIDDQTETYNRHLELKDEVIDALEKEIEELKYKASRQRHCSLSSVECNEWREVLFTNYYTSDGSSGNKTASGLTTNDFSINEDGFYTYQDKVVLATAHNTLNYELYEDYKTHELYETLTFKLGDKTYQGIVLDKCGACMGVSHEDVQRVDIFTTKSIFGKVKGKLYEWPNWNRNT